jgi:hypothetical protein
MKIRIALLAGTALLFAAAASAQQSATPPALKPIAQYKTSIPAAQRHAYFGEMHLHTNMSFDAWTFNVKTTPDMAYKFGRGETVDINGVKAKRGWPLDFMAVTDHSEAMGVFNQFDDPNNPLQNTDIGKQIRANKQSAFYLIANARAGGKPLPNLNALQAMASAWGVEIKAANDNYEPGKFTTFIAYEWSSLNQNKYNLHRNVFFNADHAPYPFSSQQSDRPEDLWSYLEGVRAQGIDAIAIPHNGNVSGGLMYDWNDSDGKPINEVYAQRRALNEPLTEIVQNKGQSDTSPELSPNDEFANYEIFDHLLTFPDIKSKPHGSYIREAYGRGLVIESRVGVNPYKYGVVGASDIHNGLSTSTQNAFAGGPFGMDPATMMPTKDAAKRALDEVKTNALLDMDAVINHMKPTQEHNLIFRPGGITGVWAEENNRDSIFAALKRKETWATSGTRIRVRFFGGWDFDPKMMDSGDWVAAAYAHGVPMGADLPAQSGNGAPKFALWAVKDPDGANLDRIQVIKIWLDGGDYKEKVFDAALSDNRKADPKTGRVRAVGNTVDLKTGKYKNTIGATTLSTVWTDPSFDPKKPAVYYVRVLEIPTPRWNTLLAIKEKLPPPKDAPTTIQERAWASPIWYSPKKG